MSQHLRLCLFFAATAVFQVCTPAQGQLTPLHVVSVEMFQEPDEFGNATFGVELLGAVSPPFAGDAKFVAPDGTEIPFGGYQIVRRSSFAELSTLTFGNWSVIETLDTVQSSFQFEIEPFQLNDVFTDTPTITSPVPGSTVPTHFVLNWEYAGSSAVGGNPRYDFHNLQWTDPVPSPVGNSYEFATRIVSPGEARIEDLQIVELSFVGKPEVTSRNGIDGPISLSASFATRSTPATFFVVPEPSTVILAGLPLVATLLMRRRGR